MKASEALVARIRPLLAGRAVAETRIIGGTGFMLDGNLAVGTTSKGDLLVRIDPAREATALARPGAYVMQMGKTPMKGYVAVAAAGLSDEALAGWLEDALAFTRTLPPK